MQQKRSVGNCFTFNALTGRDTQRITVITEAGSFYVITSGDEKIPFGNPKPEVAGDKIFLAQIVENKLHEAPPNFTEVVLRIKNAEIVERVRGRITAQQGHLIQVARGTTLKVIGSEKTYHVEVSASGLKITSVASKTKIRKIQKFPPVQPAYLLGATVF